MNLRPLTSKASRLTRLTIHPGVWCLFLGLNQEPLDYRSSALPVELNRHNGGRSRIRTGGFTVLQAVTLDHSVILPLFGAGSGVRTHLLRFGRPPCNHQHFTRKIWYPKRDSNPHFSVSKTVTSTNWAIWALVPPSGFEPETHRL